MENNQSKMLSLKDWYVLMPAPEGRGRVLFQVIGETPMGYMVQHAALTGFNPNNPEDTAVEYSSAALVIPHGEIAEGTWFASLDALTDHLVDEWGDRGEDYEEEE